MADGSATHPRGLQGLAEEAEGCRACELWRDATQVVFGAGPEDARLVLVGEQPGDREDLDGRPFVGPAGRVLDDALAAAGIHRDRVYLTNAVKHFKWTARGKRRIHQKPDRGEILACRRWLSAELELASPEAVLVCLGATAGQALLGPSFRVGASRGRVLEHEGRRLVATVHPSAVLRARDRDARNVLLGSLVDDLRRAADLAAEDTHGDGSPSAA